MLIRLMRVQWLTESKAFVRYSAMAIVQQGGFFSFSPLAIVVDRLIRADVVEWPGRKPC